MRRTLALLVAAAVVTMAGRAFASDPAARSDQAARVAAAQACRAADRRAEGDPEEDRCAQIDGRTWRPADIDLFEADGVHKIVQRLDLQEQLALDVPLGETLVPATHNSFNASAYDPTLSGLDANQQLSLTDQLRIGFRGLELDVHWFPTPTGDAPNGLRGPVLCHGTGPHAGCSADRPLAEGLAEIAAWLDAHPGRVIVIDLEDHLDEAAGYSAAAQVISDVLGDQVYAPAPHAEGTCAEIPLDVTRRQLLQAGKQVLIYSTCDGTTPAAWGDLVHSDVNRSQRINTSGWSATDCLALEYLSGWTRVWEDSTWLSAMGEEVGAADNGEPIDADTLSAMVRCGVNMPSLDQVVPFDTRMESFVWSWGDGQPARSTADRCAVHGADGRFRSGPCRGGASPAKRPVCYDANDLSRTQPRIPNVPARWYEAAKVCRLWGLEFGVPQTAAANRALVAVKAQSRVTDVWVAYRVIAGQGWTVTPTAS